MDEDRDLRDALNYPVDPDDPLPKETFADIWWGMFNRWAEETA